MVADDPGVEAPDGSGLPVGSAPGVPCVPGGAGVEGPGGTTVLGACRTSFAGGGPAIPGAISAPRGAGPWPVPDRLGGSADGGGPGLTGSGTPGGHGLPGGSASGSFGLLGVADPEGQTPCLPGAHGGGGTGVRGTGVRGPGACRSFFAGG